MAISIDFLANVGGFLAGTKHAGDALDDVAGSLDDLAADAQRRSDLGGDLGDGFSSSATDADKALGRIQTALSDTGTAAGDAGADANRGLGKIDTAAQDSKGEVGKLEQSFKDLATASKRDTGAAGHDMKTNIHAGVHETSEGVGEMKESVKGGLKEIGGSFDGTWQGAAGGAQGVIAELTAGFGPVGLLAGAIAAGALGLIVSGIEGASDAAAANQEAVGKLASEYLATGRKGKRSFDDVAQSIEDMATGADDQMPKLTDLWKDAQTAGADYQKVVDAIASGDPRKIAAVQKSVDRLGQAHDDSSLKVAGYASASDLAAQDVSNAQGRISDKLKTAAANAKAAGDAQVLAAKAGLSDLRLKSDLIGQLHDGYSDTAGEVDDYLNKETGVFNVGKYITAMQRRRDALIEYQETLAESNLSREARSYIESQGAEQAAALMAGYKHATPAQRKTLNEIWSTSGRTAAQSYGEALGDQLQHKSVRGPTVYMPPPNMDAIDRALTKSRDLRVVVGYYANTGRRIL